MNTLYIINTNLFTFKLSEAAITNYVLLLMNITPTFL